MLKCPSCNAQHLDGVICSNCAASYCFRCANITERNYKKLGPERQSALLCPSCKSQSESPLAAAAPGLPAPAPSATLDLVLQELRNGIAGLNTRLEQLPTLVKEIKDIKDRFQQFEIGMTAKIEALDSRITELETRKIDDEDYPQLQSKLTQLSVNLASKEQRERFNNVEIKGIPMKKNENLLALVCKLAEFIGQSVAPSDINYVIRARSPTEIKPIIVGFIGRYTKENIVAAARSHKNLTAADLGFHGATSKIFVNDHLTRENKLLLTKTKKEALEKNYKFIWVQNCKILVRKSETTPIICIQQDDDLKKLK